MRRIVIVGSGFGGLAAARTLQRQLQGRRHLDITLVSPDSHFVYTPLLPHVAVGHLDTRAITVALPEVVDEPIRPYRANVDEIDLARDRLLTDRGALGFDYLVLAPGMQTNWQGHPEWRDHTLSFGHPAGAVEIRETLTEVLERARATRHEADLRRMLTFVTVGAGPAGLELMAELAEALRQAEPSVIPARLKRHLRYIVVDSRDTILPDWPTPVAREAHEALRSTGIEIRTGTEVTACTPEGVSLSGGNSIRTDHVFWCGGLETRDVLQASACPRDDSGRIMVDETLQVIEHPGIYAVGDAAAPQTNLPQSARIAHDQGEVAASNLAALLDGRAAESWTYEPHGWMLTLGGGRAVAHVNGQTCRGAAARARYRALHTSLMPGMRRTASLVGSWLTGGWGGAFSPAD